MEIREGMSVVNANGEQVGRVNRFVLDPATNEVTHIVIQKGWLLPEDKVVPFEMVNSTAEGKITLSSEVHNFDEFPPFEQTHFVEVPDNDPNDPTPPEDPTYQHAPAYYWYPALPSISYPNIGSPNVGTPGAGLAYSHMSPGRTKRNIPEDTVPLKEGTNVISSDGEHVGDVERLIVEPQSNQATHFVISQGLFFKDRKLVPAEWVNSVEEEKVHLVVPARLLERLPAYKD